MVACYDIETLKNLFTCTFKDIRTGVIRSFAVCPWRNDFVEFVKYFKEHEGLIGFNNVDFDYRVLHPFLTYKYEEAKNMEARILVAAIYERAQEVLDPEFKEQREIPIVPQRDLYRIYHFNNKARMVGLKYLQINLNWHNVQEMPFHHDYVVTTPEEVEQVLGYNLNDVESTEAFYHKSKDKIRLRNTLGSRYGVNMGNFADNKIGETIFIKEMAQQTKRSEKAIRDGRTPRKNIPVRDCLVEGIKFTTKEFNIILEDYKKKVITNTREVKGASMYAVLDGTRYEFGMGGLHALRSPGLYYNIKSADVSSYYPNLAISYKIYPQHLGEVFCKVYNNIYQLKEEAPKGSDEKTAFKAALVCVFGSSNAPWSPFYDPMYMIKITINGQLLMAMLCEQIVTTGAGHVVMANTDGIEVEVIDETKFRSVCASWQQNNRLKLEFTEYKQIAIRDVNAYHAVKKDGEVKTKGDFEITKEIWKDSSMRIVPVAVDRYFREGTSVEQTVAECQDISLFIMGKRAKTGNLEYRYTEKNEQIVKQKLPKNVRYYISRSGGAIVKVKKKTDKQIARSKKNTADVKQYDLFGAPGQVTEVKKDEQVIAAHSGYRMTLFNKWVDKPFEEYNVEKQFYIREANKLINSVIQNQTTI